MATTSWKISGILLYFMVWILLDVPNIRASESDKSNSGNGITTSDESRDIANGQSGTSNEVIDTASAADEITDSGYQYKSQTGDEQKTLESKLHKDETDPDIAEVVKTSMKKEPDLQEKEVKNIFNEESSNQSFFSIGNIIKSFVEPVLDEFDKEVPPGGKQKNETAAVAESGAGEQVNETDTNTTSLMNQTLDALFTANKTDKKVRFHCTGKNITETNDTVVNSTVKIVNNTGLLNLLNFDKNESVSDCVLVLFFAPWCPFCAKMAPNYNALARAFPQLEVLAVDAAHFSNLNARFGTVLVPNILLFHQSRAVVRFNQTNKSFENLITFVQNVTGLEPNKSVNVTSEDLLGPLSSVPTEEVDYLLWISWVFVIVFSSIVFVQSSYGQQWINKVCILWQEHQHID